MTFFQNGTSATFVTVSLPTSKTSLMPPDEPDQSALTTDVVTVTAASLIAGKTPIVQVSSQTVQQVHPDVIESRITAYYYAALSNVLCQAWALCFQHVAEVDEADAVKMIIDASYRDFQAIHGWFSSVDPNQIGATANASLYREVMDAWSPQVRDWHMVSSRRLVSQFVEQSDAKMER